MERIKDNIYVETDYLGCNPGFVVTSSGIVMIDTPGLLPVQALDWKKRIESIGKPVYLINTDHHWDHTSGNYFFECDQIQHERTAARLLAEDRIEGFKKNLALFDPGSLYLLEHYFVREPRFTYSERMCLRFGGEVFELIHISGHTEDETLVYLPREKVLFSGDNVCTIGIPNLSESCLREWMEALDFIDKLDIDVLIPGHGPVGDKGSIRIFRSQLQELIDLVMKKMKEGLPRERIVEEVRYEDSIHRGYPAATQQRFQQVMKAGIGRIYDMLKTAATG